MSCISADPYLRDSRPFLVSRLNVFQLHALLLPSLQVLDHCVLCCTKVLLEIWYINDLALLIILINLGLNE